MPTSCCEVTDRTFTDAQARSELRTLRRRGLGRQSRLILEAVRSLGQREMTLLDIGGGIGGLYHDLLRDVVEQATHVDASSAYLRVAREEADRQGHGARVIFIHADFTDVADSIPQMDLVTLDRVVCCYPDHRSLISAAAAKARRALALSYPREAWYVQLGIGLANGIQRLRGDPFRGFLHPVGEMDAVLQSQGLKRASLQRLFIWEVALYVRPVA